MSELGPNGMFFKHLKAIEDQEGWICLQSLKEWHTKWNEDYLLKTIERKQYAGN